MTSLSIHHVESIKVGKAYSLEHGNYARHIVIATDEGKFKLTIFADSKDKLVLNSVNQEVIL